jgi:hypothetical protein
MRRLALLLLGWATACAPVKTPAPASAAPRRAIPELRFRWTTPAAAGVLHDRERDGARSAERFVLCARSLGGGLMEVREVAHADGLERPVVLVASDGTVYDVVGLERSLEQMLAQRGAPNFREGRLQTPAMLAQLKEKYAETWHLWVDTWLNFDPRQGTQVVEAFIPFGDTQLSVPQAFEYLGPAPGEPELVKLRMRSVLEGPEASQALARFMKDAVEIEAPMQEHVDRLELRRTVDFEIVTDPSTLMPRRVTGKSVVRVTIAGHTPKDRVQADDYQFDWRPSVERRTACEPKR